MIIVKLQGGLGNQMFQYAFANILAKKNEDKVLLDNSFFDDQIKKTGFTPRKFELHVFNNIYRMAIDKDINQFNKLSKFNWFKKKLGLGFPQIYREQSFKFNPDLLSIKNSAYLIGYFQSYKYFIGYESLIRNIFSFSKNKLDKLNQELLLKIKSVNSVAVHIRRGDFVNDKITQKYHGVCNLNYYLEAVKLIASKYKKLTLVFFSDDMEWVKKKFSNVEHSIMFIDNNNLNNCWVDMFLMSSCKHNIIANSSFSWWGAWLNNNPSKTVIAPNRWFENKDLDTSTLLPLEWIKL